MTNKDLLSSLREFFRSVLQSGSVSSILVPMHLPTKKLVMPTLVTDPQKLDAADPLSPSFSVNTARMVSRLTRKPMGATTAAVMRPCEIRAFVELVKLNQGTTDDLIIIGTDCLGAYQNSDYFRFVEQHGDQATEVFYKAALSGNTPISEDIDLATACRICEKPVPDGADIRIGLFGSDLDSLNVCSQTPKGDALLTSLGLKPSQEPASRSEAVSSIVSRRTTAKHEIFTKVHEATHTPEKLSAYLSECVNCYNCRVACPVCYCKECVFVTDVFSHEPYQYLNWAKRNGMIKMPTDTLFYHLTRMVHMSTACVGCGQCSNACPNDVPLAELFGLVSSKIQQAFDYAAGRSLEEKPPLSVFCENEYQEVVGIT